jgi:hypothetical protein
MWLFPADLSRKIGEFTVLDEFTKVREATFFGLRNLPDEYKDCVHNCLLVVKPPFLSQDVAQEIHPAHVAHPLLSFFKTICN